MKVVVVAGLVRERNELQTLYIHTTFTLGLVLCTEKGFIYLLAFIMCVCVCLYIYKFSWPAEFLPASKPCPQTH